MKNKRLIILLSIFAFLILIVVLCSTLFTVRENTISIEWHSTALTHLKDKEGEIISSIPTKENIMLIDKDEISVSLEENFPYINVLKIEKKFPNKIVVHAIERQDQYVILAEDEYYALDDQGKVLNKYSKTEYETLAINKKPILFEVKGMTIDVSTMQIGKKAKIPRVLSTMQSISSALKQCGFAETWQVVNNFKSATLEFGYVSTLSLVNSRDINIVVDEINVDLKEKIVYGIAVTRSDELKDKTDITLNVGYNGEGKLIADYKDTP